MLHVYLAHNYSTRLTSYTIMLHVYLVHNYVTYLSST